MKDRLDRMKVGQTIIERWVCRFCNGRKTEDYGEGPEDCRGCGGEGGAWWNVTRTSETTYDFEDAVLI